MIDKIRHFVPQIIFGFLFIGLFLIGLRFVNKNNPTPKTEQPVTQTETTQPEQAVTQTETTQPEQPKPRIWKGADYGLPVGVVVGGEMDNENPTLNWLSIQQPDGHMVLVKSIDGPLWVAIQKGDVIE